MSELSAERREEVRELWFEVGCGGKPWDKDSFWSFIAAIDAQSAERTRPRAMTTVVFNIDALEALHRSVYEFGIVGDYQEYDDALHGAASALFAATRERDRLAGELERERANMDATMKGWDALCESSDKTEDELAVARAEVEKMREALDAALGREPAADAAP